jgi:hypothetical protein
VGADTTSVGFYDSIVGDGTTAGTIVIDTVDPVMFRNCNNASGRIEVNTSYSSNAIYEDNGVNKVRSDALDFVVTCSGDTPERFGISAGGKLELKIRNPSPSYEFACVLILTDSGSGGIAMFAINNVSANEIVDSAGNCTAGVGPTAGQFNIYPDGVGNIVIDNNIAGARNITAQVLGAQIYKAAYTA